VTREIVGNFPLAETGFSAPVARELVHRRAVSEVFVTGIRAEDDGTFSVFAQWPRWHVFYDPTAPGFDSALVVETLRQLTVLIAHTQLGVPMGWQFLLPDLSVSMVPGAAPIPYSPAEVTATVQVSNIRKTVRGVVSLRATALFRIDGQQIAEGTAGARIVESTAYERIRSRRAASDRLLWPVPVSAAMVGHNSSWNVVLGESTVVGRWPLRVDVTNPVLFDHPLDHVPGALLIESVRQAVRLATGRPTLDLDFLEVRFMGIVELSDEVLVVLDSCFEGPDGGMAEVCIRAGGEVLVQATVGFTPKLLSPAPPRHGARLRRLIPPEHQGLRKNLHA
jgi:hypothetical protein